MNLTDLQPLPCRASASSPMLYNQLDFELPPSSSLESITDSFMLLSNLSSFPMRVGRGVMSSQVKSLEIAHSGIFTRELDNFLFGGREKNGACYHQISVSKDDASISTADMYVCGLNEDGTPGSPIVLGDMKLDTFEKAVRETSGYCVKAMEVYSGEKTITVNLGLAITKDRAKLLVNLGGNEVMHQMEVCKVTNENRCTVQAFFAVLYGAVHYLIASPIVLNSPCILPFRDLETDQLGRRVFRHNETVYKLYDEAFYEYPSQSVEALEVLGYLQNMSVTKLNERVHCLQYSYIPGQTKPSYLRQFAPIMEQLNILHLKVKWNSSEH